MKKFNYEIKAFLLFFSAYDVNFMDDVGQTLLNWASAFGTQEMVRVVMKFSFVSIFLNPRLIGTMEFIFLVLYEVLVIFLLKS